MRAVLVALVTLAVALVGCSGAESSSETSAGFEKSAPPPVDEEFTGEYIAGLHFMPGDDDVDHVPAIVILPSGETLLQGWYVPEDRPPVQGWVSERGRLHNFRDEESDTPLLNLFEPSSPSVQTIDLILTIEDLDGVMKTVLINDAQFYENS